MPKKDIWSQLSTYQEQYGSPTDKITPPPLPASKVEKTKGGLLGTATRAALSRDVQIQAAMNRATGRPKRRKKKQDKEATK